MLQCVWPALNLLSIHVTFPAIVPGAYPGRPKCDKPANLRYSLLIYLYSSLAARSTQWCGWQTTRTPPHLLPFASVTNFYMDYYSFLDHCRMKGWVGLVGWSIANSSPTKCMATYPTISQAQGWESSPSAVCLVIHSPDGATTVCSSSSHIVCRLLIIFIDPERTKGWVGLVGRPKAEGLPM